MADVLGILGKWASGPGNLCVCVCVCVWEREREGGGGGESLWLSW